MLAAALILGVGSGISVNAHAIIELNGVGAVAGARSDMTLEIQHGCITAGTGTTQVIAYIGKPWGKTSRAKLMVGFPPLSELPKAANR